jgi:transcriptional regulator GlxA family with amidase domain
MNKTRTLGILIFEDMEVLEFCGPFEVLPVANRFSDDRPAFNVLTVKTGLAVRCEGGEQCGSSSSDRGSPV